MLCKICGQPAIYKGKQLCAKCYAIKLLEDNKIPCDCGDTCGYFDAGYDEAIALIKGENE